ncbi:MAG: cytochrome-c peroxidase [Gemmatimonadota bacterium]
MKGSPGLLALLAAMLVACDGRISDSEPPTLSLDAQLRREIGRWGVIPIGQVPAQDNDVVALGRALFFDKMLSGNRDIACASCHQPSSSLADGLALSIGTGASGLGAARTLGAGREFVPRHAPTLLNSALGMFYLFWDGRVNRFGQEPGAPRLPVPPTSQANALLQQPFLTVVNRREMRGNAGDRDVFGNVNELAQISDDQPQAVWQAIMQRLMAMPEYVDMFAAAFPSRPRGTHGFEDAAQALATFQMEAFTKTNSPFDRYLARNDGALTVEQKRGALLFFQRAQCASCHSGPFLGAQQFTNAGVPQIGPGIKKQLPLDLGRGELQNNEFYRFAFRVAPLRNVELTAPYMHDGAFPTLEAVLEHYNNVPQTLRTYDATTSLSPAVRGLHHGDAATVNAVLQTLDHRLRTPLHLTDAEQRELIAFLRSLTDPSARDLSELVPARVPSGLAVDR